MPQVAEVFGMQCNGHVVTNVWERKIIIIMAFFLLQAICTTSPSMSSASPFSRGSDIIVSLFLGRGVVKMMKNLNEAALYAQGGSVIARTENRSHCTLSLYIISTTCQKSVIAITTLKQSTKQQEARRLQMMTI